MSLPALGEYLRQSGLPPHEYKEIACQVLECRATDLILRSHDPVDPNTIDRLNQIFVRRKSGEPLAYLLGTTSFYGLPIEVSRQVLIPRQDTETLVEITVSRLKSNDKVLELGCGSGAVACALQAFGPAQLAVTVTDIDGNALACAKRNFQKLKFPIQCFQGNWFEALPVDCRNHFDAIVSNPPYIAVHDAHLTQGDLPFEPRHALTDEGDGLGCIRTIISRAKTYLTPAGLLALEHGWNQTTDVQNLLEAHGYRSIQTFKDLGGNDRVTLAYAQ